MNSLFLRLIISVPVIVAATLLAPVLGVLLMILRYIVSDSRKDRRGSIAIIIIGILLLIPRWIFLLSEELNFNLVISTFFRNIVNNEFYATRVTTCAFALIIIGIVSLIVSILFNNLLARLKTALSGAIERNEVKHAEIEKENNYRIKEMQYKAQNSHVVSCPKCGADNTIVGDSGVCLYCRQPIGK